MLSSEKYLELKTYFVCCDGKGVALIHPLFVGFFLILYSARVR